MNGHAFRWTTLLLLLFAGNTVTRAFTCYPEYHFSWCDNTSEASCIHEYAFSVGHFQRKLADYYSLNHRPPLMEAYFLTKLPRPYQEQFLEGGCAAPLIFAYLLVAEAKLPSDDDYERYYSIGVSLINNLPDAYKPIVEQSQSWPFQQASERIERTAKAVQEAQRTWPSMLGGSRGQVTLEIVVVHCREDLGWIEEDLLPIIPLGSWLALYEKCGETPSLSAELKNRFSSMEVKPCRDPEGGPRGDECLGYLAHLVDRYDNLATFTVFLQADPQDHLHFSYLHIVFKMIERNTYAIPYMNLNGARHVRTITPCLSAVHEAIFGVAMAEPVGPYCCAQFIVMDSRIRDRKLEFYQNMLRLVDGSMEYDLCAPGKVTRSTHCYGMEFTWHLVFGEAYETPLRQDDQNLPTALRLKFGEEHVQKNWNNVVLAPNTPKKIVERIDIDQQIR